MGESHAVRTLYDDPMWASIAARKMALQRCTACGEWRYPPAPCCPKCLSLSSEWQALSGRGTILSWVIFHRKYFDDFEPPYNAIAVQLAEGPIMISNLVDAVPAGSWIGRAVELCYRERTPGRMLSQFRLV
jgi:uncharacterized OB-fold protein